MSFVVKDDLVTCQAHHMHLAVSDFLKVFSSELLEEGDIDVEDLVLSGEGAEGSFKAPVGSGMTTKLRSRGR